MTSFIDTTTLLPRHLGELYSDRHIMLTGSARWTPGMTPLDIGLLQVDPAAGLKLLASPLDGGSMSVTSIAGGTSIALAWDDVTQRGSSVWVDMNRLSGSQTVSVGNGITVYGPNVVPRPSESQVLVLYRVTAVDIIATASFIVAAGPVYTKIGVGTGQRVFAAIVGDDPDSTHTDLQTAINNVATGSWILVKKMCNVTGTINTNGKVLKFMFTGAGTGLQPVGATTGIQFDQDGCQMVGFGEIKNFSGYGINLNNKTTSRIEMVFSGNTNNINYGTLNFSQVNLEGSYGLTENSHISTATIHGTVPKWNNSTKKWEPTGLVIDDNQKFSGGQNIYAAIVGDNPAIDTHSDLQTAINSVADGSSIFIRKMVTTTTGINTNSKSLELEFNGYGSGISQNALAGTYTVGSAPTMSSAATYSFRNLTTQIYAQASVAGCTYTLATANGTYTSNGTTTVTVTGVSTTGMISGQSVYIFNALGAQAVSLNGSRVATVISPTSFSFVAAAVITATTNTLSVGGQVTVSTGDPTQLGIAVSTSVSISGATNALLNGTVVVGAIAATTFIYWTAATTNTTGSGLMSVMIPTTVKVTTLVNPNTIGFTAGGQPVAILSATATALNGMRTTCSVGALYVMFTVPSGTVFTTGTLTLVEPIVNVTSLTALASIGDGITTGIVSVQSATDSNLNGTINITTTGATTFSYSSAVAIAPPVLSGSMTIGYIQTTGTYVVTGSTVVITPAIAPANFGNVMGGTQGLEQGQLVYVNCPGQTVLNGLQTVTAVTPTTFSIVVIASAGSGSLSVGGAFNTATVTAANSYSAGSLFAVVTATDSRIVGSRKVLSASPSSFTFRPPTFSTPYTNGSLSSGINGLVGLTLQGNNCRISGYGLISGFSTGISLNGKTGSRIEMVFSGNATNIGFGAVTSDQVNLEGSYGLFENSHIETSTVDGAVVRWNNTKKRWEPVTGITINSSGNMTAVGSITAGAVYGAVYN